jgi:RHS repeat-associated protein
MPADFGSSTTNGYKYSIFAVYTPIAQAIELIGNPYMFTGRRFDLETGLYYYRARYYNPHIGRFLQTDPIGYGDGMNWYNYCGNNPINFLDPSGLYLDSYDWNGLASNVGAWRGAFADPDEDLQFTLLIPMDYVWDYSGYSDSFFTDEECLDEVSDFLKDTGFFDQVQFQDMILISARRKGNYFEVIFADACNVDLNINLGILGAETEDEETARPRPFLAVAATDAVLAGADGPVIPVGDAIAAAYTGYWGIRAAWYWASHRSHKRRSTRDRHQEGLSRRKSDLRGRLPRKRPKGWKGPWPPKPEIEPGGFPLYIPRRHYPYLYPGSDIEG